MVVAAKRSRAEIAAGRDLIAKRLRSADLVGWGGGYNPRIQCFELRVGSRDQVERVCRCLSLS